MDIYDELLGAQQPDTQPAQGGDIYDAILADYQAKQSRQLEANLDRALQILPEKAATAQQLAKATGLPEELVERNFDQVQKQVRVRELQSVLAASPILARQMSDPAFAKLAQEDLENLSLIERLPRQFVGGGIETVGRTLYGIGELGDVVQRNVINLLSRALLPEPSHGDWPTAESLAGPMIGEGWHGAGELVKDFAREDVMIPGAQQTFTDQVAAGVGQVGAQALLHFLTRGTASLPTMFAQGADIMAERVVDDDAPQWRKDLAITGGAVITGLTEKWALDRILGPLAVPVKNQVGAALARIGIAGVSEGGQEFVENIMHEALRQQLTNPDAQISISGALDEAGVGGAVGVIVRSIVESALHVRVRHQRLEQQANEAEVNAAQIEQLNQLAAANKMLQLSPESFEQFIEAAAEEGPVQGIFIYANTLMQSGVAEQIAAVSPAVAEQLRYADATGGGMISIPVAEYAARIAPTEYAQSLLDHLKTDPNGFSRAEAREYMQRHAEQLEAEVAERIANVEAQDEFRASQERVKQTVLTELNALGRFTESKNELDATLIAARTAVRAAQLGVTPEVLFERQRLRFAAERLDGDQFDQQGNLQTDTPAFREWFGDSKVVDDTGAPLVVYHGSNANIEVFNTEGGPGKTSDTGAFFSSNPATAGTYTGGVNSGNISPVYLNLRTPAVFDAGGANWNQLGKKTKVQLPAIEVSDQADADLLAELTGTEPEQGATKKRKARSTSLGRLFPDEFLYDDFFSTDDLARWARAQGYDGVVINNVKDQGPTGALANEVSQQPGSIYVAFRDTQIKSAIGNRGTFDPNDPNILHQSEQRLLFQNQRAPRAAFNPGTNTIALLKNADLTSLLHEAGHYFFESDIALASELVHEGNFFGEQVLTEGERQILSDVSALLRWHGIQGSIEEQLNTWHNMPFEEKRVAHERTAESFEAYLFSGEAPSIELQPYFQRFREFLKRVYTDLKNFLLKHPEAGKLNDEVRAVFDRMLATDEQIELAKQARSMFPLFRTEAEASNIGMTPEEFAAYQAQDPQATADAVQDLQARGLRDLQWTRNARNREIRKLKKQAAALRSEVQMEVRREVLSQPVYRAWQFLTAKITDEDRITPRERPKSDPDHVDPTIDPLLMAIAKLGGLNKEELVATWGVDPAERPNSGVFGKPVLRREGGRSIDAMGEALGELGYLPLDEHGKHDVRDLEERFDAALRGEDVYSNQVDAEILMEPVPGTSASPENMMAGRLDLDALAEMDVKQEVVDALKARRMTAADGIHPDLLYGLFGFSSSEQMLRELVEATPPRDEIEARTDARMLEQHGELATPEAIEVEADKAIHNEARGRMIATEANALAKAVGQRRVLAQAAKAFAQTMVARVKIRNIRPSQYANAEARAAKAAEQASRAGDIVQAAAEKRTQLVNNYATRAAYDAREEVDKGLRYLNKFNSEGSRKGLDVEYLEQIDTLLERFDLRRGQSLRAIDKRTNLAQWIANQEQAGLEPDLPDYILAEANRTHYKNLSVEEFRGLLESVRQIEHLGRLKKKLLTAKDQRELDAIVEEMRERIEQSSGGRIVDNERRNTARSWMNHLFRGALAAHRKAASVVREMDGFEEGGPLWERIIRPMNERGEWEVTMRAEAAERLHELAKPILGGEKMGGQGREFPSLGRRLNRGERLAIALNWGNLSNRQRLMGGKGWTEAQLAPVLSSLTFAEWTFVQGVWDFFESYRPEIAAKERRVYGKEPDWIEPSPFTVQTADGQTMEIAGGYYPIKYDPRQSGKAGEFAEAEDAKAMMRAAYTAATTRRSFTKTRAEEVHGRPLLLTFDGIWQGANEVIHDLAWHEWLIDANRLMKRLDSAIRTHYGAEYVDVLRSTIKDVARGDMPATNAIEAALTHVRNGSSIVGLGWNLFTALLQPLGIANSIVRVGNGSNREGAKWIGKGMSQFYGSPRHMLDKVREVQAMSEFMANRARTMNREIADVRNRLETGKGDFQMKLEGTYFLLIQRMQELVDYPTWLGAYEKAIADPKNLNPDGTIDEARAVALADQAVIDSQSAGTIKDLAQVQRGHPAMKLFTNFYSYFSVLLNMSVEQGRMRVQRKEYAGLMSDYLILLVVPAVLSAVMREALRGQDDEDEYLKAIGSELVGYPFGMFVLGRELSTAAQLAAGVGNPAFGYSGPAGLRFFSEITKLGQQAGQGDLDMALFKAANNTAGILFHYPAGQVNRFVDGTAALIEGRTENPLAPLVGPPPQR